MLACDIASPASLELLTAVPLAGTAGRKYMSCWTIQKRMDQLLKKEMELMKQRKSAAHQDDPQPPDQEDSPSLPKTRSDTPFSWELTHTHLRGFDD